MHTNQSVFDSPEDPPIYQDLVQEHGDVLAGSRAAADALQEQAAIALDWVHQQSEEGELRPGEAGSAVTVEDHSEHDNAPA